MMTVRLKKGNQITSVPGRTSVITIPRSKDDIRFKCSADGYQTRDLRMVSSASGWGVVGCVLIDLCITDTQPVPSTNIRVR